MYIKQNSCNHESQTQTTVKLVFDARTSRELPFILKLEPSGDTAFRRNAPCMASNGEQQLAMWVAWLQWIAAQLMQDLVNVILIVKSVSIQLWQYSENWKEELSLYEQLLDTISSPVFPQAEVDLILLVRVPKLGFRRPASCHFQVAQIAANEKHWGYCFCHVFFFYYLIRIACFRVRKDVSGWGWLHHQSLLARQLTQNRQHAVCPTFLSPSKNC